jgi:hypothetical protein
MTDQVEPLDEGQRAFVVAMLQKMPEVISEAILSDREMLSRMELPTEDSIQLFGRRFIKSKLFDALRDVANGKPVSMPSANGDLVVAEAEFGADGSVNLITGDEGARFSNAGLLSEDFDVRQRTIDALLAREDLSAEIETKLRGWIADHPIDEAQFLETEMLVDATPKAVYRRLVEQVDQGTTFDDLVPEEADFFAALLGGNPPETLGKYRGEWLVRTASLDPVRRAAWIALTAPIAVLRGNLIGPATRDLERGVRLRLARFLGGALDPLSQVAAFQLAVAEHDDPEFKAIGDDVLPRLLDRTDAGMATGLKFFGATLTLTSTVSAGRQTLGDWPLYAKRLAWHLHASLLVRTFGAGRIEVEALEASIARPMSLNYHLQELCDARISSFNLWRGPTAERLHALVLMRTTGSIGGIADEELPTEWVAAVKAAVDQISGSPEALAYMAPGPFDPFEDDWGGLLDVTEETAQEMATRLKDEADPQRILSDLSNLVVAFDVAPEHREALTEHYPDYLKSLSGQKFAHAADLMLQLMARWKLPAIAAKIVELALARMASADVTDISIGPRLSLLAGASQSDEAAWLQKVGEYMAGFAFVIPSGKATVNLLAAIDLLSDFAAKLRSYLAPARSFAMLAYDEVPEAGRSADAPLKEPLEQP